MEIVRNLMRRRLRSALTIIGIAVGVFALTTMGALAENFRAYTAGAEAFYSDKILVTYATPGDFGGNLVATCKADEVARVYGVSVADPLIQLDGKLGPRPAVSITPSDYIYSADPDSLRLNGSRPPVATGRALSADDVMAVVLGADFANELNTKVGDTVQLPVPERNTASTRTPHFYLVVGILQTTHTVPDSAGFMTRQAGVPLLASSLAPSLSSSASPDELATGIVVYGQPGVNLDELAQRISNQVAGVSARPPSDQVASYRQAAGLLLSITLSAAILAVLTGRAAVIHTVLMSA